jgi:acyl carrier protein
MLTDKVIQIIAETIRLPATKISPDLSFEELRIDSLEALSIMCAIETEFNIRIPNEDFASIRTVGQLVKSLEPFLAETAGGTTSRPCPAREILKSWATSNSNGGIQ